jgi:hypothetical protein
MVTDLRGSAGDVGIVSDNPDGVRAFGRGAERRVCEGRCDRSNSSIGEGEGLG